MLEQTSSINTIDSPSNSMHLTASDLSIDKDFDLIESYGEITCASQSQYKRTLSNDIKLYSESSSKPTTQPNFLKHISRGLNKTKTQTFSSNYLESPKDLFVVPKVVRAGLVMKPENGLVKGIMQRVPSVSKCITRADNSNILLDNLFKHKAKKNEDKSKKNYLSEGYYAKFIKRTSNIQRPKSIKIIGAD